MPADHRTGCRNTRRARLWLQALRTQHNYSLSQFDTVAAKLRKGLGEESMTTRGGLIPTKVGAGCPGEFMRGGVRADAHGLSLAARELTSAGTRHLSSSALPRRAGPGPLPDWGLFSGSAASAAAIIRTAPNTANAVSLPVGIAGATIADRRAKFGVGDAQALASESASRDVVVSALMLNFVSDKRKTLSEMKRVARPGGTVGLYVWDYPGHGVEFMRAFWMAAASLDPAALELTEDRRFSFCTRDGLTESMSGAGLVHVDCRAIEVTNRSVTSTEPIELPARGLQCVDFHVE
jgi:SAM-dependent methyltransferase